VYWSLNLLETNDLGPNCALELDSAVCYHPAVGRSPGGIMVRLAAGVCVLLGCACCLSACKSTPDAVVLPAAQTDTAVLDGTFADVWQATRVGLLAQGYEIYTRDKRGLFVAHSKQRRRIFVFPNRTKLTVTLESLSSSTTQVSVETLEQGYRVTLLTYPDWRDKPKLAEGDEALALLESIRGALAAGDEGTGSRG